MLTEDFYYSLPKNLIAKYPKNNRADSRLLLLSRLTGKMEHKAFIDLVQMVSPGDLLVLNNTKVIPARLFGQKTTGGRLEILIERLLGNQQATAHIKASKGLKPGTIVALKTDVLEASGALETVEVINKNTNGLYTIQFNTEQPLLGLLNAIGKLPIPNYLNRSSENIDFSRYQTVYAAKAGSVAAPTAGLHFENSVLFALKQKGVNLGYVTLHVGAGTFQPVRTKKIDDHVMHSEYMEVSAALCEQIEQTKSNGNKVICVGTTVVRALESAAHMPVAKTAKATEKAKATEALSPYAGETNLFIKPGFKFKVADCILTNFHLPQSSLLMLVCAFAGRENTLSAYQAAVAENYRFFSYGDAMLIWQ